jgi:hypothetical protein
MEIRDDTYATGTEKTPINSSMVPATVGAMKWTNTISVVIITDPYLKRVLSSE